MIVLGVEAVCFTYAVWVVRREVPSYVGNLEKINRAVELVEGKRFGEVGTRNGDIMGCVSHFATSVTAIEMDQAHCRVLRARGFNVICRDFMSLQVEDTVTTRILLWSAVYRGVRSVLIS